MELEGQLYYLKIEKDSFGPFKYDQILNALKKNEITYNTYIYKHGMAKWEPLGELSEFSRRGGDIQPTIFAKPEINEKEKASGEEKWVLFDINQRARYYTNTEVRELLSENKIRRTTYIWKEGMKGWSRIKDLNNFEDESYPNLPKEAITPSLEELEKKSRPTLPLSKTETEPKEKIDKKPINIKPEKPKLKPKIESIVRAEELKTTQTNLCQDTYYEKKIFPLLSKGTLTFNFWGFLFYFYWLPYKGLWLEFTIISLLFFTCRYFIQSLNVNILSYSFDLYIMVVLGFISNLLYFKKFERLKAKNEVLSKGSILNGTVAAVNFIFIYLLVTNIHLFMKL